MPAGRKPGYHHTEREARERREAVQQQIEQGIRPWEQVGGIESVVAAVGDLEFPKRREEIERVAGERTVATSKSARFPLATVIRKLPQEEFASIQDFEAAVKKQWTHIESLERLPEK